MPGGAKSRNAQPPQSEEDWPKPSVAVDVVALTVQERKLQVLVYRRANTPSKGDLAIPGIFLKQDEEPEAAAERALEEKGRLPGHRPLQLICVENHPGPDPNKWVLDVVYLAVVPWWQLVEAVAEGPTRLLEVRVPWPDLEGARVELQTRAGEAATLAFDHQSLIGRGIAWLRSETWRSAFVLELVREQFTLRELQDVYETILGTELYRTSFRRRVAEGHSRLVEPTGRVLESDSRKPELYRRVHP